MNMVQDELGLSVEGKIEAAFKKFHKENPNVLDELAELARKLQLRGHKRYGIKGLFEVLRYRRNLKTVGDEFKLNNNYTALYAREIMWKFPSLDGFFELRERRS